MQTPEGEIPRRHHDSSRVYVGKVLTAEIYSQYTRKHLDFLIRGRMESLGNDDVSIHARKWEMVGMM